MKEKSPETLEEVFTPNELQVLRPDKTLDKTVTLPENPEKLLTNLSNRELRLKRPILLE